MMDYDDDLAEGDRQLIETFGRPVGMPSPLFSVPVLGIFDEPYGRTDIPGGGFIQGQKITLTVMTSEINGLAQRDELSVPKTKTGGVWGGWVVYSVREIQPDGSGLSVIHLDPITSSNNSESEIY